MRSLARTGRRALALGAAAAGWEFVAASIDDRLLLPKLSAIVQEAVDGLTSGSMVEGARMTLGRGLVGLAIAFVIGVAAGVALGRTHALRVAVERIVAALYPVPRIALYPVLVAVLGYRASAQVTLVALECVFPLFVAALAAVQTTPRALVWSAQNAGAGRLGLMLVTLRSSLPGVLAGVRIAVPTMFITSVVIEMLMMTGGLGTAIRQHAMNYRTEEMFAVVLVLGVAGFVLDRVTVAVTRRVTSWEEGVEL